MHEFLDERQKAMLQELGVMLWQRQPVQTTNAPVSKTSKHGSPVVAKAPERPAAPDSIISPNATRSGMADSTASRPTVAPSTPTQRVVAPVNGNLADLSGLDWLTLKERASNCQDCRLCTQREQIVWGQFMDDDGANQQALPTLLMVLADPPDDLDEQAGLPFAGGNSGTGRLVRNMLNATGLVPAGNQPATVSGRVFVTTLTQCKVPVDGKLHIDDVAACSRYLKRKIDILKPRLILTLGRSAAMALQEASLAPGTGAALGQLRGAIHDFAGVPWVASFAPAYLLRNPMEKSKAWADLCLALEHLQESGA
jgi:uracil-DNA glycosylase